MLTADAGATAAGPEPAQVQLLSGECFGLLRQHAQIGRLLGPDDNRTRGGHPVAVLSDAYWSGHFGRSPAAIGRELVINGTAMTIVGVTQPGFFGTAVDARTADIWAPVMMQAELRYAGNLSNSNGDPHKPWVPQRELSWLNVMLRVPHGSEGAIAAEANTIAQQDYAQWSGVAGDAEFRDRLRATRISLLPGARGFSDVRARLQTPLIVLLAMVGLVLVVACANLASLLLARATHRQREMAIRLSIGAGRGRLVRQLLTESLLLALLGGAAGLILAAWGGAALVNFGETGPASIGLDVRPDTSVLLFTLAVSIATGLLFGLLPAVRATRVSLAETLKAQTRSVAGAGRGGGSTSRLLIAAQMAFSLLLLVVAALFGRSLQQLMHVDVGFDRQHLVVAASIRRPRATTSPICRRCNRRLVDRVRALPGVTSASMSGNGPFSGSRTTSGFEVQGYTHGGDERLRTQEEVVMPAYFETVGIPIVRGRGFTAEDVAGGRNVSVINETVARRYFGGRDPIGQRWSYDTDFGKDSMEIVGIAADAHYNDVKGDSPNMVYRPAAQSDWYLESLEVSVAGDSRAVASAASTMLTVLRESEPRLAVRRVETLDSRVSRSMGQERLLTLLTALFGLVALSLACLGLYGTVSYAVTRRTAELGVRMALGADRRAVRWLILREALSVVLLGLAVGLPLTLLSVRAIGRYTPRRHIVRSAVVRDRDSRAADHRHAGRLRSGPPRIPARPDAGAASGLDFPILSEGLRPSDSHTRALTRRFVLIRGASPLGLPHTRSRAPLRRRAPLAWRARGARACKRKAGVPDP